ncbi:MAG TPA: GntR family transcriptional regulator [Haliangiales bacterium]|nr:GntR family transcriptional regulator [Haliangiales bacterium]
MRNTKLEGLSPGPTLIERAYEAILDAISDRRLEPGERINQEDLAGRLQISRQPVGQALNILKSQGFVRDNGRRGLIVAPLEREFFQSIYQLRGALDAMAAELAAGRRSDADVVEGRGLVAEGRRAMKSGKMEALIDADKRFHMWTYRVAGNPLLVDTMGLYWNHLRRAMAELLRRPSGRDLVWDEHQAILDAIVAGDADEARARALAHARDASARLVEAIPAPAVPASEDEARAERRRA